MEQEKFAHLTNEELLQERKKMKLGNRANAFLVGIFIGIAVYSAANNGLGFPTLFPLFFVFMAFRNGKKTKALEKELESRNLK